MSSEGPSRAFSVACFWVVGLCQPRRMSLQRTDTICEVAVGHRSACISHLGVIALRTGLPLEWDPVKERFVGEHAKAAEVFAAREMRKPYDYGYV